MHPWTLWFFTVREYTTGGEQLGNSHCCYHENVDWASAPEHHSCHPAPLALSTP